VITIPFYRGSSRSGGAPSQLCSTIIDQLLPSGILDNYIQTVLQPAYSERYHALQGAIEEYLVPLGATVASSETVAGGYFIWLTLPPPLLAADIVQRAQQEENLRLAPGTLFEAGSPQPPSDRFANCLRLCFAWEEPRHLTEGVRRLARVLKHALE
jgi:DNA-binding transcriptional MocR family regulator